MDYSVDASCANQPDGVVGLISAVMKVFEQQIALLSAGHSAHMSTQVMLTLLWFLRRWARTYLLFPGTRRARERERERERARERERS